MRIKGLGIYFLSPNMTGVNFIKVNKMIPINTTRKN